MENWRDSPCDRNRRILQQNGSQNVAQHSIIIRCTYEIHIAHRVVDIVELMNNATLRQHICWQCRHRGIPMTYTCCPQSYRTQARAEWTHNDVFFWYIIHKYNLWTFIFSLWIMYNTDMNHTNAKKTWWHGKLYLKFTFQMKPSECLFVIISSNRPENVPHVLQMFEHDMISPIFIVGHREKNLYVRSNPSSRLKIVEGGTRSESRNKALSIALGNKKKYCIQMSDDIAWIAHHASGTILSPMFAATGLATLMGNNSRCASLASSRLPIAPLSVDFKAAGVPSFIVIHSDSSPRFDLEFTEFETEDFTASHLEAYGEVSRCNDIIVHCHSDSPCSAPSNFTLLQTKWPGVFHLGYINEILMTWDERSRYDCRRVLCPFIIPPKINTYAKRRRQTSTLLRSKYQKVGPTTEAPNGVRYTGGIPAYITRYLLEKNFAVTFPPHSKSGMAGDRFILYKNGKTMREVHRLNPDPSKSIADMSFDILQGHMLLQIVDNHSEDSETETDDESLLAAK